MTSRNIRYVLYFPSPSNLAYWFYVLSAQASDTIVLLSSDLASWKVSGLFTRAMLCAVLSRFSHVQLFATPWTVAHRFLFPWDPPGKIIGVGFHALLQGIFPTQGLGRFFTTNATWEAHSP